MPRPGSSPDPPADQQSAGSARTVDGEPRDNVTSLLVAIDGAKIRIARTASGLEQALRLLGLGLRYNVRGARHEWREGAGEWCAGTDQHDDDVRERIAERYTTGQADKPATFGGETWTRCRNALLRYRHVDPFLEYLAALPAHDGTARLSSWLGEVFETDGSELSRWAGMFIFQGAVERTIEPGCKLDETPVLIGGQGIGKSTALRCALPDDGGEWFNDSLQLAAPDKERAESLLGRVIVEASEMAGSSRAELQSLKAFLSRTDERVRLAYRRNPETLPRRCIVVGTTNEAACLPNDPTGNRRFVAVTVGAKPGSAGAVREYMAAHRDQLWAEAFANYRLNVTARLPDWLKGDQEAANEGYRRRDDILEDAVEMFLSGEAFPFTLACAAVRCKLIGHDDVTRLSMRDKQTARGGAHGGRMHEIEGARRWKTSMAVEQTLMKWPRWPRCPSFPYEFTFRALKTRV